jgi:DNA polymerase-3 subunit alpha
MSKKLDLKPSDYVHLHNHTQYSLLDGLTKVPALIERVKELGMDSIAMTDHGTMSGAIEFYKAAKAAGIKPIIGMEAYVAPRKLQDRDPQKDRQYYHLTLLAMNNAGYQNLMRLSTIANLEGFYYKPRIDHDLLEKHNDGLIVLSGCIGGEVGDALRQDQFAQAKNTAKWYKKIFGGRYYIELMDHGHPEHSAAWDEQTKVNEHLLKISEELSIPAVVTCDAHYLMHDDQEAHEILLCVQTGSFLSDENRFSLKDFHLHVEEPAEIIKRWGKTHPDLITNTKKIAGLCNVEIELGKILIPKFPVPRGMSEKSYLERLVWQGLAWRYGGMKRKDTLSLTPAEAKAKLSKEVVNRGEYELGIINSMGFNGYFLIIQDFINWGKDQGIVFGPGRGSAAGSIISYSLNITELDPLMYDLLFERFLNPDRISMPDIDIDIQDTRRNEVIQYCVEKYGKGHVANIVTFGRMAARNSVRDVARVLQVPYSEADRLAKMIPPPVQGRHIPLASSLKDSIDLKTENEENQQSAKVFDLAVRVEGTIRSHGVHAAGVVIAPDDIVNFVPLELAQKGVIATQYSMGPIEELGLLKMDFLGLSNLTIIKNALRIIKKVYKKDIDISSLPLDDKKTFELFQRGDTTGVFQFESAGMKRYLKELQPTVFDDLIAMNALYRPGPMQWIDDFISRKLGRRKTEYLHEQTENALKSTYGVLVYQEQVMQIAKDLCGFSGGQADTLRKGVAKKKPEVLKALKKDFIEGALKNSDISRAKMEEFWTSLEAFAAYCFPKAHAACYATIAYWTAYLKANYPDAFMAALMTSDYDDTDRLAIEITECKKMGIEVLPPDVNQSFHEFAVIPGEQKIRFGMDAVKNVGHGAVEEIIRAREKTGGFKSIEEYCREVDCRVVNRKAMESLAKAGALDSFEQRSRIVSNIDNILAFSSKLQKDSKSGQVDLFGNSTKENSMALKLNWDDSLPAIPTSEQLIWERELLGIYLSSHPLSDYENILSEKSLPFSEIKPVLEGMSVDLGGSITDIREITTKNGSKMAFVKLAGMDGEIELVVFPKIYLEDPEIWVRDNVILARGKLNSGRDNGRGDELKMLVDKAQSISLGRAQNYQPKGKQYEINKSRSSRSTSAINVASPVANAALSMKPRLYIRLENSEDQPMLITLKEKLDGYHGETEVVLVTGPSASKQIIKLPQTIDVNEESLRDLASVFGALNVVVR